MLLPIFLQKETSAAVSLFTMRAFGSVLGPPFKCEVEGSGARRPACTQAPGLSLPLFALLPHLPFRGRSRGPLLALLDSRRGGRPDGEASPDPEEKGEASFMQGFPWFLSIWVLLTHSVPHWWS